MLNPPKTPLQASLYRYMTPTALVPYAPERCAFELIANNRGGWPYFRQCRRKPGHGAGGLYCKQHAKRVPE